MSKEDRVKAMRDIIERVENFKGDTKNEVAANDSIICVRC